jgi:AraC-like DNA-binding protein
MCGYRSISSFQSYSNLFVKFLAFFLVVFLAPFSVLVFSVFRIHSAMVRDNLLGNATEAQQRLADELQNALREAERISFSLAYNPSIIPNIMDSSYLSNQECIKVINSHLSKNTGFNDIIIYFPGITRNLVFSSQGTQQIDVLGTYLPLVSVETGGDYASQIQQIRSPVLTTSSNSPEGWGMGSLVYCFPVYLSVNNWYMTAFFSLNEKMIHQKIRDIWGNFNGSTNVYHEDGRRLYVQALSPVPSVLSPAMLPSRGIGTIDLEGKHYTTISVELTNYPVSILTLIPKGDIDRYITERQREIRLVTVIVGIGGMLIVLWFTLRAYLPIYRLNRILQNVPGRRGGTHRENELTQIGAVLQNILQENQRVTGLMQDTIRHMQEQFLLILLNGSAGSDIHENMGDLLSVLQINLPGPEYTVFCLCLSAGVPTHIKNEISRLIRQNVVWHPGAVYPLALNSLPHITIVVSLGPPLNEYKTTQEEFGEKVQSLLAVHRVEATLFGGGIYGSLLEIDKSYIEALVIQERYGSLPGKTFLFSAFHSDRGGADHGETLQNTIAFITQSIKRGNRATALENLELFFVQLDTASGTSGMRKYNIFRLLEGLAEVFRRTGFWDDSGLDEYLEPLVSCMGVPIQYKKLMELTAECCDFVKSGNERQNTGMITGVKEYLDAKFSDPMLNLDQVAENFGVSPFHLSREFKKNFGLNFVDYLSFLRINRAKHLLAETDGKIKDIVNEIGYNDVSNFIRKFRISEGITPGQYRKTVNPR